MRRIAIRVSALAAAVLTVACGDGSDGGISPTGPMLLVGPTASVTVNCPNQMETGTSATCSAYGYDSNGSYTNSTVSSWSSSNTSVATITSGGGISAVGAGTTTITAVIDGISGTRSVTVVNPNPLSATLYGPSSVKPNTQCYWWATASGGTGSYSYSWSGGSSGQSWGSDYYTYSPNSGSFTVSVTVTSGLAQVTRSKTVTVSSSAGICPL